MIKIVHIAPWVLAVVGVTMIQTSYADPLYIPAWERQAWSKLPMSGHPDANYTSGYSNATHDYAIWGKEVHLGSLPTHTRDNYRAFYAGFRHGASDANLVYDATNIVPYHSTVTRDSHDNIICPPRHTSEYCAGYMFGYNTADFGNDPPST